MPIKIKQLLIFMFIVCSSLETEAFGHSIKCGENGEVKIPQPQILVSEPHMEILKVIPIQPYNNILLVKQFHTADGAEVGLISPLERKQIEEHVQKNKYFLLPKLMLMSSATGKQTFIDQCIDGEISAKGSKIAYRKWVDALGNRYVTSEEAKSNSIELLDLSTGWRKSIQHDNTILVAPTFSSNSELLAFIMYWLPANKMTPKKEGVGIENLSSCTFKQFFPWKIYDEMHCSIESLEWFESNLLCLMKIRDLDNDLSKQSSLAIVNLSDDGKQIWNSRYPETLNLSPITPNASGVLGKIKIGTSMRTKQIILKNGKLTELITSPYLSENTRLFDSSKTFSASIKEMTITVYNRRNNKRASFNVPGEEIKACEWIISPEHLALLIVSGKSSNTRLGKCFDRDILFKFDLTNLK
jgi:hypothetical protein